MTVATWDVRRFASLTSTNDWLLAQARKGAPAGLVALADHQRAGRGRMGRRWEAPAGRCLLVSVLLRPVAPSTSLFACTAAVALAASDACRELGGVEPAVKWPNDLVIGEEKLAGILAESHPGAVVVGIGLNLSAAPPGAVCAGQAAGRPVDGAALLAGLLGELDRRCGHWDEVAAEYGAACATVGRRVRVEASGSPREGDAVAVDGEGRLVVDFGTGRLEALAAGDVVHLRDARAPLRPPPQA